jgi:hypothetical protein
VVDGAPQNCTEVEDGEVKDARRMPGAVTRSAVRWSTGVFAASRPGRLRPVTFPNPRTPATRATSHSTTTAPMATPAPRSQITRRRAPRKTGVSSSVGTIDSAFTAPIHVKRADRPTVGRLAAPGERGARLAARPSRDDAAADPQTEQREARGDQPRAGAQASELLLHGGPPRIDEELIADLAAVVGQLENVDGLRAVLVRGNGDVFSAGADVKPFQGRGAACGR